MEGSGAAPCITSQTERGHCPGVWDTLGDVGEENFGIAQELFMGYLEEEWKVEKGGGIKVVQGGTSMGKQRKGGKSGGSCVSTWHIDMLAWLCPAPHHCCRSCLPIKFFPGYHGEGVSGEGSLLQYAHVCFGGEAESSDCSGTMVQRGLCICGANDWRQYGGGGECVVTIKDQARQVASG